MKRRIITNNKELYRKFNNLNLTDEVIIRAFNKNKVTQIVKTINKDNKSLELSKVGNFFRIKRLKPINFDIYLRR